MLKLVSAVVTRTMYHFLQPIYDQTGTVHVNVAKLLLSLSNGAGDRVCTACLQDTLVKYCSLLRCDASCS